MSNNKSSNSSNSNSGAANNSSGDYPDTRSWSDYRYVQENWGSRVNFQMSYGLKPAPGEFEEGNEILKALRENDRQVIENQEREKQGKK